MHIKLFLCKLLNIRLRQSIHCIFFFCTVLSEIPPSCTGCVGLRTGWVGLRAEWVGLWAGWVGLWAGRVALLAGRVALQAQRTAYSLGLPFTDTLGIPFASVLR